MQTFGNNLAGKDNQDPRGNSNSYQVSSCTNRPNPCNQNQYPFLQGAVQRAIPSVDQQTKRIAANPKNKEQMSATCRSERPWARVNAISFDDGELVVNQQLFRRSHSSNGITYRQNV